LMMLAVHIVVFVLGMQQSLQRGHGTLKPRCMPPLLVADEKPSTDEKSSTKLLNPMDVVETQLTALQRGEVESCWNLSSIDLRRAAGPRPRFETLLRTMPEFKPLVACHRYEVLSALQVGPQNWKCRVKVENKLGNMAYSATYTWEVTQEGERSAVQYDLGQCMYHREHKSTRGVIVGWDRECRQPEEWCKENDVDLLPKGRAQPFYHLLVDRHNVMAYVPQEMVECTAVQPVDHPKFRPTFTGEVDEERGTWRPSRTLREQYPLGLEGHWLVNRVFPDRPPSPFDA